MITSKISKAARALADMTQEQLANSANMNKRTLMDFESGKRVPIPATLQAIQSALEAAGVEFIPENGGGAGVRLAKNTDSK